RDISLSDRTDLTRQEVLLSGTQALVRLMLMQRARDMAAGHDTAGLVTGYRGSPLGGLDMAMERAGAALEAAQIRFFPALNEDLAATSLWGAQSAGIRGEGRHDGVFGLWYGKGPGVDRSGDALRHANLHGTAALGGVVMAMGDDHTGESSTTCHQSEFAAIDAQIPVLSPAGVQEILDFGLYGFALSRYAGLWTALKLMKDTVESSAVVDGRPDRMTFVTPDFALPEGGLNIRAGETAAWRAQEVRLMEFKRPAAVAFARANGIDRVGLRAPRAEIGLIAAGKNWLDLCHALSLLDIDGPEARRLGIATYKLGQVWPIDTGAVRNWATGLKLLIVIEEKRKLIEAQLKEGLYGMADAPRIWGGRDGAGRVLFPEPQQLDPAMVARKLGAILLAEGRDTPRLRAALDRLAPAEPMPSLAERTPYFCAGCPHNTSTVVPEGARAAAGIGCHTMALWMDRQTEGLTQMGAEGANWVGEAPFSTRAHIFQNMGDGTYNHSGLMAIRFAVSAGVNITYKILFNDAVAMTGGQGNDGGLTAAQVAREVLAVGVAHVALVHDPAEALDLAEFPKGIGVHVRDDLPQVQKNLGEMKGVSVLLYVQTCAAEKRRRRKRGTFPAAQTRVFIDPEICEGCGDCGVQSNCVALVPLETELGTKRAVDQSACNQDLSCLKGFCPALVSVTGGRPRRGGTTLPEAGDLPEPDLPEPDLPEPDLPGIDGTHNIVITGIGGTGVVSVGAVLAMAAHLEGKGTAMIEMSGMAQKGGAVQIHCRIAARPDDITAVRIAEGECDTLLSGDPVVSTGAGVMALLRAGRTSAAVNAHAAMTGAFARDRDFRLPVDAMEARLSGLLGDRLARVEATRLAERAFGDSIFANMIVVGLAWQKGLLPLTRGAIEGAIRLNGAAVERNIAAFALGRRAAVHPEAVAGRAEAIPPGRRLQDRIDHRARHLEHYQDAALAARYRAFVARFDGTGLEEVVAEAYHRLLAIKDEYEVARLLCGTSARAGAAFEGPFRLTYHLAPPFLPGTGPDGRPRKRAFGPWLGSIAPVLARMKRLRGGWADPFAHSAERRRERALIVQYEADMEVALDRLSDRTLGAARELAALPLGIRGFGPVKAAAMDRAEAARPALLARLRDDPPGAMAAE
ncbi:MAG: indolepyruvate ferredoxin oxidoreductase family protein, partial [Rubellimicrobium sp.]|nr:indolepyruvate ferredoxin oxidoreductase family protein [Rubellimicrobium sp.]